MNGAPKSWPLHLHVGVCLEERDGGAGRVEEDGEPAHVRNFLRPFVDGCAERLRLFGRGLDVLDTDVGQPEGGHTGYGEDAAAWTRAVLEGGVDHVAHVVVVELPVEEFAVELFGLGGVGGTELEVDEGIGHCGSGPFGDDGVLDYQQMDSRVSRCRKCYESAAQMWSGGCDFMKNC